LFKSAAGCIAQSNCPATFKPACRLSLNHVASQSSSVTPEDDAKMGNWRFFFSALRADLWCLVEI
jgi:predicted nicotinamide N-methyase